jgi:RNA polymerase sigma-70 factor (ECF subfamily)
MRDQADDIAQNAMIQLLRMLEKSEGNPRFSSMYLAKAAHGATVDEIRRRCRRKENLGDDEGTVERASSRGPSPETESAARELGRGIQDCLAQMLRPRRVAVTLHIHGCTVKECARRLRWTFKKTESLVYRGLKDLRRCLSMKGMNP